LLALILRDLVQHKLDRVIRQHQPKARVMNVALIYESGGPVSPAQRGRCHQRKEGLATRTNRRFRYPALKNKEGWNGLGRIKGGLNEPALVHVGMFSRLAPLALP
jgi:hypothetical protein